MFRVAAIAALGVAGGAWAQSAVPAAVPVVGDMWVYEHTIEKGANGYGQRREDITIQRVNDDGTMVVGIRQDGAPGNFQDHVVGADWSIRRTIDGEMRPTMRPLDFPLRPGKSWTVDFADPTRRGPESDLHVHRTYTVAGWETVSVPAGSYRALKIVARGTDRATKDIPNVAAGGVAASPQGSVAVTRTARGGRRDITVQAYAEIYYVPELKTWAKSVEEQWNADGVRLSRDTHALVAFKPGG